MGDFIAFIVIIGMVVGFIMYIANIIKNPDSLYGILNPEIICPHCQIKGFVFVKNEKQKKGISGAKATGAILTGGLSILATGLSRKEMTTKAYCKNCNSTWHF
jgi:hypothetical protein